MREFYSALPRPVRVGIEATGSMQWFLNLSYHKLHSYRFAAFEERRVTTI